MVERNQFFDPGAIESIFTRVLAESSPKAIGRGEMVSVIFQNPLLNADGTSNNNQVWIGSGSNMIWLLIPGQESPQIYCEDQKDVYVRRDTIGSEDGMILSIDETPGLGGVNYTAGDVLEIPNGNGATITVLTVDADGQILTWELTTPGSGYSTGNHVTEGGTGENAINFSVKNAGGALYAPGDTFTVDGGSTLAEGVVDTVDGGGAVLTYHLTNKGAGYLVANGVATTATGGSLGVGFTINVTNLLSAVVDVLTVQGSADVTCLIYRLRKGGKQ